MASDTAFFFMFFGFAFIQEACSLRLKLRRQTIPVLILSLISLYGLLKFLEFWIKVDLTFSNLITPVPDHLGEFPTNRMSPLTGLFFACVGTGYFIKLVSGNRSFSQRLINYFGILTTCAGSIFVIGYSFGTPFSYNGTMIPLALPTALGFCTLGVGTIALADQQSSIHRHFSTHTARGRLMRFILPIVAIAILLEGYLHNKLLMEASINTASISAALTIGFVLITGWTISVLTRLSFKKSEEIEQERIKTTEELRESEERFRLTFETNTAAFSIMRVDDFSFVKINQGLLNMTGYTPDDLLGKSVTSLDLLEDPSQLQPMIDIVLMEKKIENVEVSFKRKDGTRYPGILSAWLISLNGVQHVMTTTFDISQLKEKERQLVHARLEAENASRLKDYFIANVSHEIRTPLNAIIGFTDLLVEEVTEVQTEITEKYSGIIAQAGKRLMRTVDMIMNLSRLRTQLYEIKETDINLDCLVKSLIEEQTLDAQTKGIDLLYSNEDQDLMLHTDLYCVTHSISNLIDNSIKFTQKGTVSLTIRRLQDNVEIKIQDTGIGMEEEYLQKVFEPFSQEDMSYTRQFEGIGLGMAITKQLVDAIGGKISVASQKSVGTQVAISIPIR